MLLTEDFPWLVAIAFVAILLLTGILVALRQRRAEPAPLPDDWSLTARPVFSSDERRVYRQLREALPHHIVLSKLPLVRFCQPTDPQQVRYWYDLLGATHVGFAICSANGRVLAAIDIDTERGNSRRALQIKQKVLAACRVRYLRCPVDHLPSVPELQLLVPQHMAASRAPQAAVAPLSSERAPSTGGVRTLWKDSGFFHDSFFGADSRADSGTPSEMGAFMRSIGADDDGAPGDPRGTRGAAAPLRH